MKIFLSIILIGISTLYADRLKVIGDKITLTINMKKYIYQVGEYPLPKNSLQVCYVSGDGKAILNNDMNFVLDRNSSFQCYQVPHKKKAFFSRVLDKLTRIYSAEVIDINPTIKSAAGTRSMSALKQLQGDLEIEKNIPYIVIQSDFFGEPPVYLNVLNAKKDIVKKYFNGSDDTTLFLLKTKDLSDGGVIEVINKSGKVVLKRKIVIVD